MSVPSACITYSSLARYVAGGAAPSDVVTDASRLLEKRMRVPSGEKTGL